MRFMTKGLVVASAGFAMLVTPAAAADYQNEMREMRELVMQLQDQVQTQQEQINIQQDVLQDVGLEDERGSASMMSSLLESTDFSGHVAASYFYNTDDPVTGADGGGIGGNAALSNPFHPDHNSFQVDEVWIGMSRDGAVGFEFEVVYGATATAVAGGGGNSNDVWIPTANLSYETPWGPTLTAGKFATTIGAESANSTKNVNITRGITYNMQPISHTGATLSGDMGGIAYTIGFVNGAGTEQPDGNSEKGFLWGLSMGNDTSSVSFNGIYEEDGAGAADSGYTLDLVANHNASDNLTMWANLDYISAAAGSRDPWSIGLSLGSRLGINDDLGIFS